jgi:hypothetical protein
MNIDEAIKLLEEQRGFEVKLITYKYEVSDEDGKFNFDTDDELISYAEDQKNEIDMYSEE